MSATHPTPNFELNAVLHELVTSIQATLGDTFIAVYLQGSFAVSDWDIHSDVDFLVAIEQEVSAADLSALQAMHARIYDLDSNWAKHLGGQRRILEQQLEECRWVWNETLAARRNAYERREDFAHQNSRYLVNTFQVLVFEELEPQKMGKSRGMRKSIRDAAWSQLISYTVVKAEEAGRTVVLVDPRYTSQMCSGCGQLVQKDLSVRVHDCHHCGLVLDRDHNAAINILGRGLGQLRL